MHRNAITCGVIRCHALVGVRKVDAKRGYTILIGAIKIMGTYIAAVSSVALDNLPTPGGGCV